MPLDANSAVSPSVISGMYTGTTAAQTVTIGFRPSWIQAYNITDGDTQYFWTVNDLANVVSVVALAATSAAVITVTDHGFVLPASNAIVNENTKVYAFIAGR